MTILPMKRRELSDDILDATEPSPSQAVELLSQFNVGEYWETTFSVPRNPQDTAAMMRYIAMLKEAGLDIGKGDCQFGYKMPIPDKDEYAKHQVRSLQIFKRR